MNKWDKRFMDLAEQISTWSSCYKMHVGAVIVKGNRIITTGYNGAPQGIETCNDRGYCWKEQLGIQKGNSNCFAIHAEQNAILQAAKMGVSLEGCTLYCTHKPCNICTKSIINSGITRIVYKNDYIDNFADYLIDHCNINIKVEQFREYLDD